MKRKFWRTDVPLGEYEPADQETRTSVDIDEAVLVGSETDEPGMHMPVLDIDYGAMLLPSSTSGHFHLYLNKAVTWAQYKDVLMVLGEVGLLQKGFVDNSIRRGQSFCRTHWTHK